MEAGCGRLALTLWTTVSGSLILCVFLNHDQSIVFLRLVFFSFPVWCGGAYAVGYYLR